MNNALTSWNQTEWCIKPTYFWYFWQWPYKVWWGIYLLLLIFTSNELPSSPFWLIKGVKHSYHGFAMIVNIKVLYVLWCIRGIVTMDYYIARIQLTTVKPVYSGQQREYRNMAVIHRWPLYGGWANMEALRSWHKSHTIRFLGHRSQKLQWPIVITRCPASVRRLSSVVL